ncbi:hypothetical protein [Nocardia transvalensis]|uniref:hypothetical protein n=1 Tax=Nocardia transvalensis TaxID=37333 RepID=UPI00189638D4|nr:hypothetical protein [Nocardia transvalensis]MBF6333307.1 hypothetical protein [Nocardia transvalensis]
MNLTSTFPLALLAREPDANGDLREAPFYQPATGALELGMVRCTRDHEYRQVSTIIGPAGQAHIHDVHLSVYTLDQDTGDLTLHWNSGDIKGQLNAAST